MTGTNLQTLVPTDGQSGSDLSITRFTIFACVCRTFSKRSGVSPAKSSKSPAQTSIGPSLNLLEAKLLKTRNVAEHSGLLILPALFAHRVSLF